MPTCITLSSINKNAPGFPRTFLFKPYRKPNSVSVHRDSQSEPRRLIGNHLSGIHITVYLERLSPLHLSAQSGRGLALK